MTKADDILVFFCVSAFFAGLIIAVATLPVKAETHIHPSLPARGVVRIGPSFRFPGSHLKGREETRRPRAPSRPAPLPVCTGPDFQKAFFFFLFFSAHLQTKPAVKGYSLKDSAALAAR
jgi:hypothetical protein